MSRQAVDVANDHMESMWQMVESHGSRLRLRRSGLGHGVYRGMRFPVGTAWGCASVQAVGHESDEIADGFCLSRLRALSCIVLTRVSHGDSDLSVA